MKRVIQIAATAILGCLFFMQEGSAQTKKLYESKVDMKLPSYLHNCKGSYGAYETIDVKYIFKYYYDKDDNRINEGPIKITGNYKDYFGVSESAAVISANVSISGNYANDVLSGAMSATYNEKVEGRLWNDSYSLTLKTTFKNDVMVGTLTMDSSLNVDGEKEKQWWHITLDSNGKPKSIDCQVDGRKVKASYNDKGEATGELVDYDGTMKFTRNVAQSVFMRKTGEVCACEAEQKALLDKYAKGLYTEEDLFRAGYILASYKYPTISFDKRALQCVDITERNLGDFGSISISIKILKKEDVLLYEDLLAYVDPEKAKSPLNRNNLGYNSYKKQVLINGDWYYAPKSDYEKFVHVVDSIARVESADVAKFLFASLYQGKYDKVNMLHGCKFTPRDDVRNFDTFAKLGH